MYIHIYVYMIVLLKLLLGHIIFVSLTFELLSLPQKMLSLIRPAAFS